MDSSDENQHVPRGVFYCPVHRSFFYLLATILGIIVTLLFLDIVGAAFKRLFHSLSIAGIILLFVTCLLGSLVNIPLKTLRTRIPIMRSGYVTVLGFTYPIPTIVMRSYETLLVVNLGGAIIPTLASLYLLVRTPQVLLNALMATILVTIVVKTFARPVRGVGITVPGFIPPLAAVLLGIFLGGTYGHVVAYISGTLGTLIGADLLNLNVIPELGAPVASIGGAGTFDGVFLSGIIAVILF